MNTISLKLKVLLFISVLFTSSCNAEPKWDGKYIYDTSLGTTVGGSSILMEYTLTLSDTDCHLAIDGFQTMDRITCRAVVNGDHLAVLFKSFDDGSTRNPYGVEIYKVDEALFELQRKDGKLLTTWKAEKPGEKFPVTGEFFQPLKKQ